MPAGQLTGSGGGGGAVWDLLARTARGPMQGKARNSAPEAKLGATKFARMRSDADGVRGKARWCGLGGGRGRDPGHGGADGGRSGGPR